MEILETQKPEEYEQLPLVKWSELTHLDEGADLCTCIMEAIEICRAKHCDVAFDFPPAKTLLIEWIRNQPGFSAEFSLGWYACLYKVMYNWEIGGKYDIEAKARATESANS